MDLIKYSQMIANKKLKMPILKVIDDEWIRAVDEYIGKGDERDYKLGIRSLLKIEKLKDHILILLKNSVIALLLISIFELYHLIYPRMSPPSTVIMHIEKAGVILIFLTFEIKDIIDFIKKNKC